MFFHNFQNLAQKIFSVKPSEVKILLISIFFIFLIFASYTILRPLRDASGLTGGTRELKWLFLATFVLMIFASLGAMILSSKISRKNYLTFILGFFVTNLLIFWLLFQNISADSEMHIWVNRAFYIWVSVFNVFVVSSAWSLLADIFSKESSLRLFGIISSGASLGAILGAALVSALVKSIGADNFIFLSTLFLFLAIVCKFLLISESKKICECQSEQFNEKFNSTIGSKNPFEGFKLIFKSHFLLAMLGFILLLTSVSTFLYMEQARIIELFFHTREERAQAFASIDLIVQGLSFILQIFFTAKIAKIFGAKFLLGFLGFLVGIGFLILAFAHPSFLAIVIVMSVRRVGEYALIKPGREMLFVPLGADEKYKVKNFLDSVVYRGGDALASQLESLLAYISIGAVLIFGATLSFVWGTLGVWLGGKYQEL